jgi:hypothetical protein
VRFLIDAQLPPALARVEMVETGNNVIELR